MKRAPLVLAILLALPAGAIAQSDSRPAARPAAVQVPAATAEETPEGPVVSRFSGKPVPRFETLRWAEVNGRTGPSLSSPIAWQYNRKGLPVMVVKESGEWYRVRDPVGDEVWVHMRMLAEGATAIVTRTTILGNSPARDAEGVAEIGKGVLVQIQSCDTAACEVETGGYRGWMPRANLWGATGAPAASAGTKG